ncbi:MAG: serine hydrolase domain-containing protein [Pseudomonadota bacterium]
MAFDQAFALLKDHCENGRIPGGVLGLVEDGGRRRIAATGLAQLLPDRISMKVDTWFDLASLTKVIFTTERVLNLASAGQLDLDAPLVSVLPDLRQYDDGAWERQVTFRQCLGHQTPFPAVEPIYTYGRDPAQLRAFALQRAWTKGPPVYSDINFILLGIALERLEGRAIRDMEPGPGFSFHPPSERSAATEDCTWRGRVMRGEVHDENCFALQGAGHAGLFGTADAVLDFASGLLRQDAAGASHVRMLRARLSPTRGHGWEIAYAGWSGGDTCEEATIGHTGFTGTGLWIDFAAGRAWTLLTNRVHPSRHTDSGITDLRRAIGTEICVGG